MSNTTVAEWTATGIPALLISLVVSFLGFAANEIRKCLRKVHNPLSCNCQDCVQKQADFILRIAQSQSEFNSSASSPSPRAAPETEPASQ